MEVRSNSFCASGMHLPNGSFASFGGNDAVGLQGKVGATTQTNPDGTGMWDSFYNDFDGRVAIRIVNPCTSSDNLAADSPCGWYDESTQLFMKRRRWYAAAEATGDGTVVILGGFVTGGFVNRWVPNVDPTTESGSAENTYEFYPARAEDPPIVQFLVKTSGLNAYAHTFLQPSGLMLVQANTSTSMYRTVIFLCSLIMISCSVVGLQQQYRNSAARHAQWRRSRLSGLRRGGDASYDPRKQL